MVYGPHLHSCATGEPNQLVCGIGHVRTHLFCRAYAHIVTYFKLFNTFIL